LSVLKIDRPYPIESGEIADPDRVAAYLQGAIGGLGCPLEFFKFQAGNSNLTYLVRAGGRELVLKREPPGAKAKSAHDMRREYRVISAVHDAFSLAPMPLLLCEDPEVIGGNFFVMERVPGVIVRQETQGEITDDQARAQFERLISAMADLHRVNVEAGPLAGLGRPEGYRLRQVEGWIKRLADARTPETPVTADIEDWLVGNLPEEPGRAALVHNDFKLDNLVWDPVDPTRLVAVLDWEMATLGDPLMDLGVTLSFWVQVDDPAPFRALRSMPSDRPGVPGRAAAWRRYLECRSERSEALAFYLTFAFYRRAVIEQQKLVRFRSGQTADLRFAELDAAVAVLLAMAHRQMDPKLPAALQDSSSPEDAPKASALGRPPSSQIPSK
jgi:aminoglycoside phosphotransferase (APT) family kinase protein